MTADQPLTVDLYARADAPVPDRRSAVVDRLEQLRERGRIDGFDVIPWPRAVSLPLSDRTGHGGITGTVRSFEQWAASRGLRICPPFEVRPYRSSITGETDDLLVLPVLCLAAHRADDLVWMAPVTDGERVVTVEDALAAVAAGRSPVPDPHRPGEDPPPDRAGEPVATDGSWTEANGRTESETPDDRDAGPSVGVVSPADDAD